MRSLSKNVSSLVELMIYAGFVAGYFLLVLHPLDGWIGQVFQGSRVHYALLALGFISLPGGKRAAPSSGVVVTRLVG